MLDNTETEKRKKPTFLIVLVVLSFISIGSSTIDLVSTLISGPLSQDQLEQQQAEMYEAVSVFEEADLDNFIPMIEKSAELLVYVNNEIFLPYNILTLVSLIIGFLGVFFMLQLKRIGFHLYVIYSLLPVILMYILIPMNLIISALVISTVVLSALFCVLYGLNLKHMK
ncbi:MAG: hypothetical protein WED10_11985 [Brumimicrobium sp.]